MISLTFLGATRTVTGSKYLLEINGRRLLVDCGMFQGLKELRLRNWEPLPVPADSIAAVVLTHAHVDHSGFLPRLVAEGFGGRVFCTAGTADLCRIVLPDAGRIAEEDAREANRHQYTRHDPALPLFTEADAIRALGHLQPFGYERAAPVLPGVEAEFVNAGHLLGSGFVVVSIQGPPALRILFSGDLGRYDRPILPDPSPAPAADVLLVESTYGDKVHEADDQGERLAAIVRETVQRGGKVIVPAFAIGRVEEVIYWLKQLEDRHAIPVVPVYLDSPMAVEALQHYSARSYELDPDVRPGRGEVSAFCTRRFRFVSTTQQSMDLACTRSPAIIISSSGMATGGRVLFHLASSLPDRRNTVLFTGYQAAGTRGRDLVEGAREVKIHGEMVQVAARIEQIQSMSAHADQREILRWLSTFGRPPRLTYLVHGEPGPMDALRDQIRTRLNWTVETPEYLEHVRLDGWRHARANEYNE
jgi:metallo-beta-lactamase family protein